MILLKVLQVGAGFLGISSLTAIPPALSGYGTMGEGNMCPN